MNISVLVKDVPQRVQIPCELPKVITGFTCDFMAEVAFMTTKESPVLSTCMGCMGVGYKKAQDLIMERFCTPAPDTIPNQSRRGEISNSKVLDHAS